MSKIKDLLARFKRVFTVAEWKREAQDAMRRKEFVIESLDELRRVEKAEMAASQERTIGRTQNQGQAYAGGAPFASGGNRSFRDAERREEDRRKRSEASLADLMNMIRRQQESQ